MTENEFIGIIESIGFNYKFDAYKQNVKDYCYIVAADITYTVSFYYNTDKVSVERVEFPHLSLYHSLPNNEESRKQIISVLRRELPALFRRLKIKKLLDV